MSIHIPAMDKTKNTDLEVSEKVFGQPFNEPLVHQLITAYLANARAGTKAQKTRSEVSGGGAKPWKQKGSGRARAGSTRSPIWRTGGVTFAAKPRSYAQKLNKKMYRAAMRSIFSELLRQNRLSVSDDLVPETPKTAELKGKISTSLGRVTIVMDQVYANLVLASRNLVDVDVMASTSLSPVALVNSDMVVLTSAAIKQLEERLA